MTNTLIQDMLEKTSNPNIISFTLGLPDEDVLPNVKIQQIASSLLNEQRHLQYANVPNECLKSKIVILMKQRGVQCTEDEIIITTGAQQALFIACHLLLKQGDSIWSYTYSYPGLIKIVEDLGVTFKPFTHEQDFSSIIPISATSKYPKAIFAMSDGRNPQGDNLSYLQRKSLAELSIHSNIPIIEDDAYWMLSYDKLLPPIKSFSPENTIYISTFSKTIAPSLRVGWMVIPKKYATIGNLFKDKNDLNTMTFGQHIINDFINDEFITHYLPYLSAHYLKKRNIMLNALNKYFPTNSNWRIPQNGFFVWVTLPKKYNTSSLLEKCMNEYQVAYMPSEAFATTNNDVTSSMRLCFSHSSCHQILKGVENLGKLLHELN